MCFGNSQTLDDPTQPAARSTKLWGRDIYDPTQQPIHTTESNDAEMSKAQDESKKERKGSHKHRPEFVDVTDQDHEPRPIARTLSGAEVEAARPMSKKSVQNKWRSKNSAAYTYAQGAGMAAGATFAANAM
ncbi:uncharacterized protein Z520_11130 [Fonsecaea multimorphosa CBS 102226]|uniref:Uncharacterized protein n=1 Tax=Fonsecaea multimorphosa CBS 102226 TaxID=1442371 RepID=A0A0D2K9J8_9EURO|nr:uncharacterized protein Z520_11130 [Fonsecaea multimorphosa CBS 102226]KIX93073.1 hypothetical protein Z520_11130 [Fonsecaea multimorphosa CBS 102226]OAL18372.1 hypothetical protein AYO22_10692 [Fonsecaea multimorphosa]